jgi:hypothetical protein
MPNDAVQGLREVIATGTEEEATQYIQDHFQEFPKEMRQRIVTGLFTDAAQADLAERMAVADIKSQILSLLQEFDALDKAGEPSSGV